jgi:hypothetical protein
MRYPTRVAPIAIAALVAVARHYAPHHAETHEMTVIARDYAFDAPDSIPTGVTTIHLENHGVDLHHVWLVRLDSGYTAQDYIKSVAAHDPLPAWATFLGGPNPPAPDESASATIDLPPGHYLLTCLVPASDGVPHIMKGMVRPLTVTGMYSAAPLPRADVTMTLVDYGFELSHPLAAGTQVIRVHNAAAQLHEVFLTRLAPGKSIGDLPIWVDKRTGAPPALPLGGVAPIPPGMEANFTVDLAPGEYGLICFVPDVGDGKPHFAHGMMRQITVGPVSGPSPVAKR